MVNRQGLELLGYQRNVSSVLAAVTIRYATLEGDRKVLLRCGWVAASKS